MNRRAFTLVEMLVALTIIVVLLGLVGVAVGAARANARAAATRQLIGKLDEILSQQLQAYESRAVDVSSAPPTLKNAYRAWSIRRNLISGDLPDRWTNVEYMYLNSDLFVSAPSPIQFPADRLTVPQRLYLNIYRALVVSGSVNAVMAANASAECLFMIVTQGGIADCLDCGTLRTAQVGDKDGDGMLEFWDDWKNPIGFLLWAPAVELPAGSGRRFFDGARALDAAWSGSPRPTLGMRPLIYSCGPDGEAGYDRYTDAQGSDLPTLSAVAASPDPVFVGSGCGISGGTAAGLSGRPNPSSPAAVLDNITNLDMESK